MIAVENFRVEKFRQQRSQLTEALLTALQNHAYDDAAHLLEGVVQKGCTHPDLWYCRTFFQELPGVVIHKSPLLMAGMVLLHSLGHRPALAEAWLKKLRALAPQGHANQTQSDTLLAYLALHMPEACGGKLLPLLQRTAKKVQQGAVQPMRCTLCANRPSVFNGMFDLSCYAKNFPRLRAPLEGLFATVYDETAQAAADMIQAEIYYQQNKLIDAFSLASSAMNILNRTDDGADMLFTAMFIVLEVLMFTGQIKACEAAVLNIRDKIVERGAFHLLPGVKSLQVWIWLYTGKRENVEHWLAHEAPNEHEDYNMLDKFVYFGKVRAYLALEQPMLALGLCQRLRPMLNGPEQPMQVCELEILLSMAHAQMGAYEQAFACLERCLPLGEKYGYYRLFADEGEVLYTVLQRYIRHKKPAKTPFLTTMTKLTHEVAVLYPNYLKLDAPTAPKLTPKQLGALRLAAKHFTNGQIAAQMHVSNNAVTGYFRRIFTTLGVSSRHQAVEVARRMGLLA